MNNLVTRNVSSEKSFHAFNGWAMLFLMVCFVVIAVFFLARQIQLDQSEPAIVAFVGGIVFCITFCMLVTIGFFTLEPNTARIFILFGAYKGTLRESGFFWANPFYKKMTKISLRSRNLNGDRLKVNDKQGNPIEIAAVIVWQVSNTAQAYFDVENYESYVKIQSESAVRHLANSYAYDHSSDADDEKTEITLRNGGAEVALALQQELQERLNNAGIYIEEARLTHLAYAPEIAQAMLRRQQATAVLAARSKIVRGAVGMVEMALQELAAKNVIQLDDERKAAMVSNLLVVLCGETEAKPVLNTGTLYN